MFRCPMPMGEEMLRGATACSTGGDGRNGDIVLWLEVADRSRFLFCR